MPHLQMMEERLEFLNIDSSVLAELRKAKDILEPAMDEMLDRFYAHILGEPALRALFVDEDAIEHARSAQKNHWLKTLFDGKHDNAYFDKTARIGRAHARIGLTPNWYIGGYCQMLDQFIELIANKCSDTGKPATQMIQAVSKVIFLDMDLVIHCYLDAKDNSMRQILRRATGFTADVTTLSDDLNAAAAQIKATAEKLSAEAVGQLASTSTDPGSLPKHVSNTAQRTNELLAQAEQLSRHTARLSERLTELQFRDKLYVDEDISEPGTIARLKALVLGKK
ncbi:MAG: protoglobin domain-containing protein [Gammaproteobacteria bacterium]|nr:protoglobin domain-containing protein [Gammaproteobacteria bacterium]